MEDHQLVSMTIEQYGNLQRIKQANGGQENPVLDYAIKIAAFKLSLWGVNVEDITLT